MKFKKIKKSISLIGILSLASLFIVWTVTGLLINEGIFAEANNTATETYTIKISGSTTCLPVISECADEFMKKYTNFDIQVTGGGSSVGITQVGEEVVDIGMSSRELKSSELSQYNDLKPFSFASDGIAVIISTSSNAPDDLTMEQLRGIYNGTYTNWNDVGGDSGTVVLMGRDSASGTRVSFEELTGLAKDSDYADYKSHIQEYNSNGGLHDAVKNNDNAIGYVGLGYIDSDVKGIDINGVEPTVSSVKAKTYPISRSLYLITNGKPNDEQLTFLNYIFGPDGQEIVLDEGFVSLYL